MIEEISEFTFVHCTSLRKVFLPATLHTIRVKAFMNCEEIPCRDVHLARCLQFAMHKFRLSLFVKDLEPGGSTTFCFLIV